uniref:Putative zinc finger transcription factor protein 17 n=1 Tax=Lygus hesperus TaxID=30085 RepID=A0A0A9VWY5_LYGHE
MDVETQHSLKYACPQCEDIFSHLSSLRRHKLAKHAESQKTPKSLVCPSCDVAFSNFDTFEVHLKVEHDFEVESQSLSFDSEAKFEEWKRSIEQRGDVKFVIRTTVRSSEKRTIYFRCNRSGKVRLRVTSDDRKRERKSQGSRKIDSHCPARITASVTTDGRVTVLFCKSHFGHEMKLAHIPIPSPVRRKVASQIASKVPLDSVLEETQTTLSGELRREHLISMQDFHNIVRDFGLNCEVIRHSDDSTSVEAWVESQNALPSDESSVLFYKAKGSKSPQFPQLKESDFMLAIMTLGQKEILEAFGHDVICLDSTHGTNGFRYKLTTLLVLDEFRQGFPCAFLITDRNDHEGVEVFLNRIKEKVGTLNCRVLMTDMAQVFYNSWKAVMGDCPVRLFSSWHVMRAWQNKINATIKDKTKKQSASHIMYTLLTETDENVFSTMLTNLVNKLCSDDDTSVFGKYIEDNYKKSAKNWAYCFRERAGINTNMHLERMHGILKHLYLKGTSAKRIDLSIDALMKLINSKLFDRLVSLEKISMTLDTNRVLPTPEANVWTVAASNGNELYKVSRLDQPCTIQPCLLNSKRCETCFHVFSCTCIDFSIQNNVCEHIHLVCRFLGKCANNEDVTDEQMEISDEEGFLIEDEHQNSMKISELTNILSSTSTQDSPRESIEDLKQEVLDLVHSALNSCQTREQVLSCKRIASSMQPVVDASIYSAISFKEKEKVNVRKKIDPQRRFISKKKKTQKTNNFKPTIEEKGRIATRATLDSFP